MEADIACAKAIVDRHTGYPFKTTTDAVSCERLWKVRKKALWAAKLTNADKDVITRAKKHGLLQMVALGAVHLYIENQAVELIMDCVKHYDVSINRRVLNKMNTLAFGLCLCLCWIGSLPRSAFFVGRRVWLAARDCGARDLTYAQTLYRNLVDAAQQRGGFGGGDEGGVAVQLVRFGCILCDAGSNEGAVHTRRWGL